MKIKKINLLCGIAIVLAFAACSLGGDLDDWREKAIEANTPPPDTRLTVTFYANGGSPAPGSFIAEYGNTIAEPPSMDKLFGIFDAWYKDQAFTAKWDFNKDTVIASTALYAKWIFDADEFQEWLIEEEEGLDASSPVEIKLDIDLGDMQAGSGWRRLLTAIGNAGKYVNLDLSACIMATSTFVTNSVSSSGKDRIVSLVLPNAARTIGDGRYKVFAVNFSSLKKVSGKNISSIANYAFQGNGSLVSIDFPAVTDIGNSAFSSCRGLASVNFPLLKSMSDGAFQECISLFTVVIPASVNIENNPFVGCTSLDAITITGNGPLKALEGGKALVLNNNHLVAYPSASGDVAMNYIKSIGAYAFRDCENLTSISFPAVTSIGGAAFFSCNGLSGIYFPEAISMGDSAFGYCKNLTDADFPKLTSMGSHAFGTGYGGTYDKLVNINFPVLIHIPDYAFSYRNSLSMVSFPEAVSIDYGAFGQNQSLTELHIPKVTSIGESAVSGSKLNKITIAAACSFYNNNSINSSNGGFIDYYNSKAQAGGTYAYVVGAWTGP